MNSTIYIYIFILTMALATYACRVFAFTVIRHPIENRFFQSFLYYVPYVTLAVMTFPAIIEATNSPIAGAAALIAGIIAAWLGTEKSPRSKAAAISVGALRAVSEIRAVLPAFAYP